MRSFKVIAAHYDEVYDRMEVVKQIIDDDGNATLTLHLFHPETLEWRAAEYGIEDHDELIDLLMHEPFINDVNPLSMDVTKAKALSRLRVSELKDKLKPHITIKKEDLKTIMLGLGVHQKYIDALEIDPYMKIKSHCKISADTLKGKQVHVKEVRQQLAVQPEQPKRVTATTLQAQLASLRRSHITNNVNVKPEKLPTIHLDKKGKRIK